MGEERPRLLYVVNNAAFFLSHRLPIAVAARKAGFDVHVATPPGEAARRIAEAGFPFHPIRLRRGGKSPVGALVALLSLWRLYRRLHPDVVHHVTIKPVLLGGIAARLACVPAVVHAVSGLGYAFLAGGALRTAARALYRFAFGHGNLRVIFQNPDDREELDMLPKEKSVLIRGAGVDLDEFRPSPEPSGPPVVLLPARMLKDKGVGEFVEAARALRGTARFVLCGAPDPANPNTVTRETLEVWQREGAVEWWGHKDDMPNVLRQCHVVCLPSYYKEGLPKALLEAAASGRPIVTTFVPGCREAVKEGVNGLTVPPRDVEALVAALRALIEDPDLRASMGAKGRRIAEEEFSVEEVARRTLEVYRELSSSSDASTIRSAPKRSTRERTSPAGARSAR